MPISKQANIIERHNLVCSIITKAISKIDSLGSCFVSIMEAVANGWLCKTSRSQTRIIPKWLFPNPFSDKN